MSRLETRRRFFRSFLGELAGFVDEVRGVPQYRLDGIAELPEEVLLGIRPVMMEHSKVEDGCVLGAGRDGPVPVFTLDEVGKWMVARFDGQRSNAEIARCAELELGLESEAAQQRVLALFLVLARKGVCVPSDAPQQKRGDRSGQARGAGSVDSMAHGKQGGERG